MICPDQDPIVSDARGWSWPGLSWGAGRDLNLGTHGQPSTTPVDGSRARTGDGRPVTPGEDGKAEGSAPPPAVRPQTSGKSPPVKAPSPVETGGKESGQAAAANGWRAWLIGPVILAFALFHAAPHLADWLGDPRQVLGTRLAFLPFNEPLTLAACGWLWEPTWVWLGATALRLRALQRLGRDPAGGVSLALIALIFQTIVWFTSRPGPGDPGLSGAEQSALIVMLFVEGAIILCLYGLTGRGSSSRA